MCLSIYFRHDAGYISLQQLRTFISDEFFDDIVGMHRYSQLSFISRDDDYSCSGIFCILGAGLFDYIGLVDIFKNNICFLQVFHIVAFLVGDFQQKFTIDDEKVDAIIVDFVDRIELCFELVFVSGDGCAQIL